MQYISKRYIKEKWEPLKRDMEWLLKQGEGDRIQEEDYMKVAYSINDNFFDIMQELGI